VFFAEWVGSNDTIELPDQKGSEYEWALHRKWQERTSCPKSQNSPMSAPDRILQPLDCGIVNVDEKVIEGLPVIHPELEQTEPVVCDQHSPQINRSIAQLYSAAASALSFAASPSLPS
jgi:hypothetical protein